jgi:hypothetical protein
MRTILLKCKLDEGHFISHLFLSYGSLQLVQNVAYIFLYAC